jgi:hypothetical protein
LNVAAAARISGGLLVVAGIAFLLIGIPSFVAPSWAVGEFPWTVGPFLAQTIGAWCIGNALICFHAVWLGDASRSYPLLVYLWLFGIGEVLVAIAYLDLLQLGHVLTWPYLVALGALVGSWFLGVLVQSTGPEGESGPIAWRVSGDRFVPTWAKAFGAVVGLFVLFLAIGTLMASPGGAISRGEVFPEHMGQFSIRSFSAFLFAVAGAIGSVLLARSIEPYVSLGWAGLYLVVPITLAALLNLSLFGFDRPGGLVYVLAYVTVGLVIGVALWTFHTRPESVVGEGARRS